MSVTTFEGVVDRGQIKLPADVQLPDKARVYVIVPEYKPERDDQSISPPATNASSAPTLEMEVISLNQVEPEYPHLELRPDKDTQELHLRGRGIKASTIWHDRYVLHYSPEGIAFDRDLPLEAVYEALDYCQKHWEDICAEKEREKQ
jgi:uncharacterized protein (DUF433 family)